ncbi:unnamed protein product [Effrenium voratum]|uniref:EF-hand domain-containing protein n=1 Tax=Effrenium voratum TaxID=2562239 RepID=A0AA36JKM2_9DINO|nr:unnamed protein product [Effrenium voratum]
MGGDSAQAIGRASRPSTDKLGTRPPLGCWEFPLSRAEKVHLLLDLYSMEVQACHLEVAKLKASDSSSSGCSRRKAGSKRRKFGAGALGRDDDSEDGEGGNLPHGYAKWASPRQKIYSILTSEKTDWFLATMILSSLVILIVDADLTAKTEQGLTNEEKFAADITTIISTAYTCIYAVEMVGRLYVFRRDVFRSAMLFDFLIVTADVALLIGDLTLGNSPQLSFLRMFRLARLFRFVRVVGMFPELQFLVKGFISSFSAVFWGSILMWVVILMWAIIAVYWIHPVNQSIMNEKAEGSCGRECRAWASVWYSVITLCQTVVFGDSWGATAIEIIEREPWTLLFFAGMYGTITLGVLNLIVAAIVDSGAQAREEALEAKRRRQRIEELRQKERQKNRLLEICQILDDDESGSLSFEELLTGYEKNAEFRAAMKDYNIDRRELDVLFRVFDEDGAGVLDYQEFFNLIDSAREQASQQVLTFVRFAVMDLRKSIEAGQDQLKSELDLIKDFVLSAEHSLNERICRFSGEPPPTRKALQPLPAAKMIEQSSPQAVRHNGAEHRGVRHGPPARPQ